MTQAAQGRCDCGGIVQYRATASPWEFDGRCSSCKRRWWLSWAHKSPPPVFVASVEPVQGGLFSEASA